MIWVARLAIRKFHESPLIGASVYPLRDDYRFGSSPWIIKIILKIRLLEADLHGNMPGWRSRPSQRAR